MFGVWLTAGISPRLALCSINEQRGSIMFLKPLTSLIGCGIVRGNNGKEVSKNGKLT